MPKTGLLDLPPELRNRIFAMVMQTDQSFWFEVKRGVVKLYVCRQENGPWESVTERDHLIAKTALLQVNRQIRTETTPAFYYYNKIVLFCHVRDLKLVAAWLSKHPVLSHCYPELYIEGVTWRSLDRVWPFVEIAHDRPLHLGAPLMRMWNLGRTTFHRLEGAYREAVEMGAKAGREGKRKAVLKNEFKKWLASYQERSYVRRSPKLTGDVDAALREHRRSLLSATLKSNRLCRGSCCRST